MTDIDARILRDLAAATREAVMRQPVAIRDQLSAGLDAGDIALRVERDGIACDVDGREVLLVPWSAVAVE